MNKPLIVCMVAFFLFCCGIIMTTSAGLYFFDLLDYFAAGVPVLFVGALECIVVAHVYGMEDFLSDLKYMTGYTPSAKTRAHFSVALWTLAPLLITLIIIADFVTLVSHSVQGNINEMPFPAWAIALGWFVVLLPLMAVPCGMIRYIRNYKGRPGEKNTFWQKVRAGLKHSQEFKTHATNSGEFASKEQPAQEKALGDGNKEKSA